MSYVSITSSSVDWHSKTRSHEFLSRFYYPCSFYCPSSFYYPSSFYCPSSFYYPSSFFQILRYSSELLCLEILWIEKAFSTKF